MAVIRMHVGRTPVDACSLDETVAAIVEHAAARRPPVYVVTPNAQHVALLQRDATLRGVYEAAWRSVPDGVPLLWAARFLGSPLRGRVNGTDLFEAVCRAAPRAGLRVYLLGGRPTAAARAATVLRERCPGLDVCTACPPVGFETDAHEAARVEEGVRRAAPHVLFVGLGTPKQELWLHARHARLGVPVCVGVGGSFDLIAGLVPRAPVWMQGAGLEWLFRLSIEPARLWKRYAVTNPQFVAIVAAQVLTRRVAVRGRQA